MARQLTKLVPGNRYAMQLRYLSGDAFVPADNRVQFVLDNPPTYATRYRITKVYNPAGGSDIGMSASGDSVLMVLSPAETELMAPYPGQWQVSVSVGEANVQNALIPEIRRPLPVDTPDGGAVPNGD